MPQAKFSIELAQAFFSSAEDFPVDLDQAWVWLGYNKKFNAVRKLTSNFIENRDFLFLINEELDPSLSFSDSQKSRPDKYLLSVECFKRLAMMAETEEGEQVRIYFLDCEKTAKAAVSELPALRAEIARLQELMEASSTVKHQVVTRPDPAAYMQGVRCEANRVWSDIGPHDRDLADRLISGLLQAADLHFCELTGTIPPERRPTCNRQDSDIWANLDTNRAQTRSRPIYRLAPLPLDLQIGSIAGIESGTVTKADADKAIIRVAVSEAFKASGYPPAVDAYSVVLAVFTPELIKAQKNPKKLSQFLPRFFGESGYVERVSVNYYPEESGFSPFGSGVAYIRSAATTNA